MLFTQSISKKNLTYTTGDILDEDILINGVDAEGYLQVSSSADGVLSMEMDGVSKTLNGGEDLAADTWYGDVFVIPRNTAINFSFNKAATIQFYINIMERR